MTHRELFKKKKSLIVYVDLGLKSGISCYQVGDEKSRALEKSTSLFSISLNPFC